MDDAPIGEALPLPEWMRWNFEAGVGRLFEVHGFVPVRRGWPDYAIFRRDGTLKMLVEVKSPSDTVTFAQHLIHDALRAAGIDVRVVRHEDIPALIEELGAGVLIGHGGDDVMRQRVPAAERIAQSLETKEKRQRRPVSRAQGQPREKAYCIDTSCSKVLRHPRHRISRPPAATDAEVEAAMRLRSEYIRNGYRRP